MDGLQTKILTFSSWTSQCGTTVSVSFTIFSLNFVSLFFFVTVFFLSPGKDSVCMYILLSTWCNFNFLKSHLDGRLTPTSIHRAPFSTHPQTCRLETPNWRPEFLCSARTGDKLTEERYSIGDPYLKYDFCPSVCAENLNTWIIALIWRFHKSNLSCLLLYL